VVVAPSGWLVENLPAVDVVAQPWTPGPYPPGWRRGTVRVRRKDTLLRTPGFGCRRRWCLPYPITLVPVFFFPSYGRGARTVRRTAWHPAPLPWIVLGCFKYHRFAETLAPPLPISYTFLLSARPTLPVPEWFSESAAEPWTLQTSYAAQ